MTLATGTKIGPYEITGPLGAGGMGEVYRARDPRLGRDVAIKMLPVSMASDPERLARFEREAKLLASLSHPNIAGIHGLEEANGHRYLILEFVDGETLADRLKRGALPVEDALEVCMHVASALEAAHESGIVHRDLKPGNIMLSASGAVKVLDFGLAKGGAAAASSSGTDANLSASPTMTFAATGIGRVLGTAAYMSPEQARGKTVDRRTDIWSFGCVLFECLTARQCFEGETLSDMIAKILQGEPEWNLLPINTPESVRVLLARCLERDSKTRLRDIGDARIQLEETITGKSSASRASGVRAETARRAGVGRRVALLGVLTGMILGAGLYAAFTAMRARFSEPPVVRYTIDLPDNLRMAVDFFSATAEWEVSPDGGTIAILAWPRGVSFTNATGPKLFVRRLSEKEWKPIDGSDLAEGRPMFTRDGRSLVFSSRVSLETQDYRFLKTSLVSAGPPVAVCEYPIEARGGRVLPDGRMMMFSQDRMKVAFQKPGDTAPLKWQNVDFGSFKGSVDASPVSVNSMFNDHVMFVGTTSYGETGWHRGTGLLDLRSLKLKSILVDGEFSTLLPGGHLAFTRGDGMLLIRFDRGRREVVGEPSPILEGVRTRGAWIPGAFQVTSRGDLFYPPGGAVGSQKQIMLETKDHRLEPIVTEPRAYTHDVSSSPDGRRVVAIATNARGIDELWLLDAEQNTSQRIVGYPDADVNGVKLSLDGKMVAYDVVGTKERNGTYISSMAGEIEPRAIFRALTQDSMSRSLGWFPDGQHLIARIGLGTPRLFLFDAGPNAGLQLNPKPLLPNYVIQNASVSPNGRYLAFESDRSGNSQIFVCPITSDGVTGTPVLVARSGFVPEWSGDGARVFYGDSTAIKFVRVQTEGGIAGAPPQVLLDIGAEADRVDGGHTLPDGRSMLVMRSKEDLVATRIEVIQNWTRMIRGKLGK